MASETAQGKTRLVNDSQQTNSQFRGGTAGLFDGSVEESPAARSAAMMSADLAQDHENRREITSIKP